MFTTNQCFFFLCPALSLIPARHVLVCMTAAVESKNRRDRGWLSVKTCSSVSEVQDVLAEMCNGAMLTGLDWISDGEKVITDRHGVPVGM
jgi:hypothetical protein